MFLRILLLTLFFLYSAFIYAEDSVISFKLHEANFQSIDSASGNLDTPISSLWTPLSNGIPQDNGQYWVQVKVDVFDASPREPLALFSSMLGSYEVYWNKELLASNGIVGVSADSETPGEIIHTAAIPQHLWTQGQHTIEYKVSNYFAPESLKQDYFFVQIAPHTSTTVYHLQSTMYPLVVLGALLLLGGFSMLLYFIYIKKVTFVLFSMLNFAFALLLIAESWKIIYGYSYDWHLVRLQGIEIITLVISALIPGFFLSYFNTKFIRSISIALIIALLLVVISTDGYDQTSRYLLSTSIVFSWLVALLGALQKRRLAIPYLIIMTCIAIASVVYKSSFQDQLIFLSFYALAVLFVISLSLQIARTQKQKNIARLRSAHLEITLLKQSIQPHFIFNTLASIEQWIEESPALAIEFIDELAQEFRLLLKMSEHTLVPISEEVHLCKSHLKIMSFRYALPFTIEVNKYCDDFLLPPAILHTLIENSFTHNNFRKCELGFVLNISNKDGFTILQLQAPTSKSAASLKGQEALIDGTGTKYIKGRLSESYDTNWEFAVALEGDCWITTIKFPYELAISKNNNREGQ